MAVLTQVAHLDHSVEAGGAELALRRLITSATANGLWQPTLVIPRQHTGRGVFQEAGSYATREIGPSQPPGVASAGSSLRKLRASARLASQAAALRRNPYLQRHTVVHANTTRAGLYGAIAFADRLPVVLHLRDLITDESLGRWNAGLYRRLALRRATAVIANSAATLESAASFLSRNCDASVIPSPAGVRLRLASDLTPERENISRVGMVARLAEWKGQRLLLQAFAAEFGGEAVELHLIGGAPFDENEYRARLIREADGLGIGSQLILHGHVADVSSVISTLDVCVQASLRPEPLGQNVIQYLAMRRPVIAVNSGGPAELVLHGRTGLLTEMGSLEALRAALAQMRPRRFRQAIADSPRAIPDDEQIARQHREVFERARSSQK